MITDLSSITNKSDILVILAVCHQMFIMGCTEIRREYKTATITAIIYGTTLSK